MKRLFRNPKPRGLSIAEKRLASNPDKRKQRYVALLSRVLGLKLSERPQKIPRWKDPERREFEEKNRRDDPFDKIKNLPQPIRGEVKELVVRIGNRIVRLQKDYDNVSVQRRFDYVGYDVGSKELKESEESIYSTREGFAYAMGELAKKYPAQKEVLNNLEVRRLLWGSIEHYVYDKRYPTKKE